MIRRPRRVLPATLAALVLLAAGVVVAVSCIQVVLGRVPWLPFGSAAAAAADLAWNAPAVLAGAAVVAALGIVVLLGALVPGTPTVMPLAGAHAGPAAGVTRSSLVRALTAAAAGVDGVGSAAVRVRARTVTTTVRTPLRDPGTLVDEVRAATVERLADVALLRSPRIRVRVRTRRADGQWATT